MLHSFKLHSVMLVQGQSLNRTSQKCHSAKSKLTKLPQHQKMYGKWNQSMALDSFKRAHLLNISGPIFRGTPTEASQWVRPSGRIDLIPFVTLATPILPFHLSWHKCLEEDQLR